MKIYAASSCPLISKIISGGQTGADRGGLDAAIALGIEHGGWCPRGGLAEDGQVPLKYQLIETAEATYPPRTRRNVIGSDASVIFTFGPLTRGSRITVVCCIEKKRPYKHIDLTIGPLEAAMQLEGWLPNGILNVAGSRESKAPGIQKMVKDVLLLTLRRYA